MTLAMYGSVCVGAPAEGLSAAEEFRRQRVWMSRPERLCFLVDVSTEMSSPWEDGEPRIEAVKAAVRLIYRRKVNLCPGHSFAVMTFDHSGRVTPLGAFSSKASDLDAALEGLHVQPHAGPPDDAMDLSLLIDDMQAALRINPSDLAAARYIHRCIIIYGRSDEVMSLHNMQPKVCSNQSYDFSCSGSSVFIRTGFSSRALFLHRYSVYSPSRQRAGGAVPIRI